jgi:hypothetical protein
MSDRIKVPVAPFIFARLRLVQFPAELAAELVYQRNVRDVC